MRTTILLSALCAALTIHANPQTAEISIQPISSSHPQAPLPFASISYDLAALDSSTITSYDAPDIPESSSLVRIGVYDPKVKSWLSGTTVASTENFAKGYSPTITVSVNSRGDVLSAALKGVQIDAGQTRDFGPKVVVLTEGRGPQPVLNKPVVVSKDGKKVEEEVEKTFLQKYVISRISGIEYDGYTKGGRADHLQVLVDDWHCSVYSVEWWRWRAGQIEEGIEHRHINRLYYMDLMVFWAGISPSLIVLSLEATVTMLVLELQIVTQSPWIRLHSGSRTERLESNGTRSYLNS